MESYLYLLSDVATPISNWGADRSGARFQQIGTDAIRQLVSADNRRKLSEFSRAYSPFFAACASECPPSPDEDVPSIAEAREFVLLALELKRMADEDDCSRKSFEKLGFVFFRQPADSEYACLFRFVSSKQLGDHIRALTRAEEAERLEAASQDKLFSLPLTSGIRKTGKEFKGDFSSAGAAHDAVAALEDDTEYVAVCIHAGKFKRKDSYSAFRAKHALDSLLNLFLTDAKVRSFEGKAMLSTNCVHTTVWLFLLDSFDKATVATCRTCGRPYLVFDEREGRRKYCGDNCKRMFMRAKKYAKLVQEGVDPSIAAKESGIALKTAEDLSIRNNLSIPAFEAE